MASCQRFDVAIVGAGIAGLTVALSLPPDWRVALFTKGRLGESNTRYAQGGLAAALGPDDSPELHYADTLAAGAGLCDPEAVRVLVEEAPAAVRWLIELGVRFDRAVPGGSAEATTADGLLLGQEAAHCRRRILHAGGDATGAEIERALLAALKARSRITIYADTPVCALLVDGSGCSGLQALDQQGQPFVVEGRDIVLACGGTGSLWAYTSNPAGATADGLALAWRAGAALADLEFVQFHPTVLKVNGASHLISEAVRGEGAYLRNHAGERFMPRYHPLAELAPRDVVARAILSEMLTEGVDCQYLDLTHLPDERMYARFPTIAALCRRYGLDLAHDLLPVAPAAHYCMGGIQVDLQGRSSVPHLYAVGEVACTGVHGANRLASNSLLEGLVFGRRLAALLRGEAPEQASCAAGRRQRELRLSLFSAQDQARPWPLPPDWIGPEELARALQRELRDLMWRSVSLCRDEEGLRAAWRQLLQLRARFAEAARPRAPHEPVGRGWLETANMLDSAALVVQAALARRESRGSHWRRDYPQPDPSLAGVSLVLRPALQSVEATSCPALQHKGRPYV
ncbi:L-aspartate oxidase [Thermogemmatispora tikiterensis]|uniref:L-aspartate oxidase n=1 Tax=Thermogemmatispora tikiterensis TaxID=1825093 RepID=A0A328V9S8_9CHLR|nr:L-aspartate oxidase [Thermogemmatispora tikiterensis]RAQ94416.1 L-aspartate oxidase [Thermogemmatispora tikiterensis]